MSASLKRNLISHDAKSLNNKRQCRLNSISSSTKSSSTSHIIKGNQLCTYRKPQLKTLSSSESSDDDDDDDDDNDNEFDDFENNQFNSNKKRSFKFSNISQSAPIDSQLSRAVAQYSDDDEEEEDGDDDDDGEYGDDDGKNNDQKFSHTNVNDNDKNSKKFQQRKHNFYIKNNSNINRKRCKSTNDILKVTYNNTSNRGILNNKRYSVNISDIVKSIPSECFNMMNSTSNHNTTINNNNNNNNSSSSNTINNNNDDKNNLNTNGSNINLKNMVNGSIPRVDFIARSRCFEYLVGAIDEAWARYCDSTSYDEDVAYGFDDENNINEGTSTSNAISPNSNVYSSEEEEGYKTELSATTTVTEYDEDEFNNKKIRAFNMNNNNPQSPSNRRVSEVPENVRLQQLKDRFTKAKYYLEDLVDSDVFNDCLAFWTKWDLIKYCIVDFVEEDEEDDDIERRIEELESGRFAGSLVY